MGPWLLESYNGQRILTHFCRLYRANDTHQVLRQDIGGGYVRCSRCDDKFLASDEPGNPHLLLRFKPVSETADTTPASELVTA